MRPLPIPTARRRAEQEFAELLEGRLAPSPGPEPEPLRVAAGLSALGSTMASEVDGAFRDQLRGRLLAVAAVRPADDEAAGHPAAAAAAVAAAEQQGRRAWRPVKALAGVVAAAVTVGGVAWETSRSLPGEPLYGIKRTTEALQVTTAGGAYAQGQLHLRLAEIRLGEVKALARDGGGTAFGPAVDGHPLAAAEAGGDGGDLLSTLTAMDAETNEGRRLLIEAARVGQSDAPLATLEQWSKAQNRRIADVLPDLPVAVQSRAQASLVLTQNIVVDTGRRIADSPCGGTCAASASPSPGAPLSGTPGAATPAAPQPGSASAPACCTDAPAASQPPADVPPVDVPPVGVPPVDVPPVVAPPVLVPPTDVPPTGVPPTDVPTSAPVDPTPTPPPVGPTPTPQPVDPTPTPQPVDPTPTPEPGFPTPAPVSPTPTPSVDSTTPPPAPSDPTLTPPGATP